MMEYPDEMVIEAFDHVELRADGAVFEGQIVKLHPKLRKVTVRYADFQDCRRDGEPKQKTTQVSFQAVDLVRRDG